MPLRKAFASTSSLRTRVVDPLLVEAWANNLIRIRRLLAEAA
jgi:hypothetical protein